MTAGNLSSWGRGATNVALAQEPGIHPLCRVLQGVDRPQTARFPAWYGCRGGGKNDTVVCSSTERLHEHRTSLSDEEWGPGSLTKNLRLTTDPTISSTWWAFEGQRETPRYESNGVKGSGWIDCNGYYAFGGEVDSDKNHRRSMRRAFEDEQVPRAEHQDSTEFGASVNVELKEDNEERNDRFVHSTDDDCDPMWTSWPAVQEAAIANGTVLVFDIFPSVGNLFVALHSVIKAARLLEVALVFKWERFQGFRAAFDPASIKWDLDPTTLVQRAEGLTLGAEVERLYHSFKFLDAVLVLSSRQLETLARQTGIPDTSLAEMAAAVQEGYSRYSIQRLARAFGSHGPGSVTPCAWNMLLRRSPSMMASLEAHNPWTPSGFGPRPKDYVAWHIRTSDGETKESFMPDVHRYIFHGQSSTTVFSIFLSTTDISEEKCPKIFHEDNPKMVFLSSNSKSMARNCTALAAEHEIRAGFVDLGIDDVDAHTNFSKNPNATALNAFIDYLYLVDSSIIVHTGSSFPFTAANIKDLLCIGATHPEDLPVRRLIVCLPRDC